MKKTLHPLLQTPSRLHGVKIREKQSSDFSCGESCEEETVVLSLVGPCLVYRRYLSADRISLDTQVEVRHLRFVLPSNLQLTLLDRHGRGIFSLSFLTSCFSLIHLLFSLTCLVFLIHPVHFESSLISISYTSQHRPGFDSQREVT